MVASPALMLYHRDTSGVVLPVAFAYRDGRLSEIIEPLTEYLASIGPEAVWEAIAADHLRHLLLARQANRELRAELDMLRAACAPMEEAAS